MIKPKHNFFIEKFFEFYTFRLIRKNFHSVQILGEYNLTNLPILLLSNHISWWDGFWSKYLNTKIFKHKFHFLMLEHQLKKYWYFQYTGGFSIKQNSKSVFESLDYTIELLKDKTNLVLFFPQGQIESQYNDHIVFRSGLKRILSNIQNPVNLVFQVNLIDYLNHKKPSLFIYFLENLMVKTTIDEIETKYNNFLKNSISIQKLIHV